MSRIDFFLHRQFAQPNFAGQWDETPDPHAIPATPAPEISVVMAAHNAGPLLDASIASVLAQSFGDFELIVVDDGSHDDSLTRLLDLAATDPRIRVLARPHGGLPLARNIGVGHARAPLLAFLNAGDLWAPQKLAWHIALHRDEPQLAGSHDQIGQIGAGATSLAGATATPSTTSDLSHLVVRRDWFQHVGGFDTRRRRHEDKAFLARILSRRGRIASIDALLTGCRGRA